jgi:hypothetical protein
MYPNSSHVEAAELRRYVEAVATAVGVEPAATWVDHGSPATAYVALADHSPSDPDRLLMLQWHHDQGWALAVEPHGAEAPQIIATWPETIFPEPAALAKDMRQALDNGVRPVIAPQ